MKKAIRTLAVVLCLVLCATALTGCTVNLQVNVKTDGAAAPANNSATPTPTPTPTPSSSAPAESKPAESKPAESKPAEDSKPADSKPAESSGAELSASSSKADIVAEYIKVYNTTKAAGTFKGHDEMTLVSVMIDGKDNSMIKNAGKSFVKAEGTDMPLPPYSDDNPANECLITDADIESATYTDNGDGTATIKLIPVEATNSKKFQDAQGKMFNVMEDVKPTVEGISILSWASGDTDSNVTLTCKGSYAEVTYDKASKMMTKADYTLITIADVQHANVLIFKDKSASATFDYKMKYPG